MPWSLLFLLITTEVSSAAEKCFKDNFTGGSNNALAGISKQPKLNVHVSYDANVLVCVGRELYVIFSIVVTLCFVCAYV